MLFLQLLVAFGVGALLMYGYTRIRGGENAEIRALQTKLGAKTAELEAYKQDVQEHFLGTAEAVDTLTQSYRGVFEQLEQGANRLVGETRFRGALNDRAALARGVPTVAVIDEARSDEGERVKDENARGEVRAPAGQLSSGS